MCGVFAYLGESQDVGKTVGTALKRLEYRGYDSWGIAWEANKSLHCTKKTGRVNGALPVSVMSTMAFGHTRWATHGEVTDANAHPHADCSGRLAVVHNGVIENVDALRIALSQHHHFQSSTDSEVIAHLLEERMAEVDCSLAEALRTVFPKLEGFNAVVAIDVYQKELAATKYVSPLVLGSGPMGDFITSDVLALSGHTQRFAPIEDGWLVSLGREGLLIEDLLSRRRVEAEQSLLPALCAASATEPEAGVGQHMLREMREQPAVVRDLLDDLEPVRRLAKMIGAADQVVFTGCGSAYYAAEAGRYLLARIAGRAVSVLPASEFRQFTSTFGEQTLIVALTQSGETADLIDALMAAEEIGAKVAAIVNVEHSTIARRADLVVPLRAGTERCVLATKSFIAKLTRLIQLAHVLGGAECEARQTLIDAAQAMERYENAEEGSAPIKAAAEMIADREDIFVIGRGVSYPAALEAALKIKEGSYVHAEAFAGGELKHGVISLIEDGTPCLVFAPGDETHADVITGAQELRSRGGTIIGASSQTNTAFDIHVPVPDVGAATLLLQVYAAQQLAHQVAMRRGTDPDHPRNLAKSVTVK